MDSLNRRMFNKFESRKIISVTTVILIFALLNTTRLACDKNLFR